MEEDDTPLPAELKMDEYDEESDVEIDLFENNDADDDDDNIEMEVCLNIFLLINMISFFHSHLDNGTRRYGFGNRIKSAR